MADNNPQPSAGPSSAAAPHPVSPERLPSELDSTHTSAAASAAPPLAQPAPAAWTPQSHPPSMYGDPRPGSVVGSVAGHPQSMYGAPQPHMYMPPPTGHESMYGGSQYDFSNPHQSQYYAPGQQPYGYEPPQQQYQGGMPPPQAMGAAPVAAAAAAPETEKPKKKKILGMPVYVFWIVFALVVLIILAALGVGLGVGLSKRDQSRQNSSTSNSNDSDPTSTRTTSTRTTPGLLTPTTRGLVSPTATSTPTSPNAIPSVRPSDTAGPVVTCPSDNNKLWTTSDGSDFRVFCNKFMPSGTFIDEFQTASMEECMTNCDNHSSCTGIRWWFDAGVSNRCDFYRGLIGAALEDSSSDVAFAVLEWVLP